jgi:hypothetical protein
MSHVPVQFHRVGAFERKAVTCFVDGLPIEALEGDTILTLLLLHRRWVRRFEFGSEYRAGFCLIGACQDCWIRREDGRPLRSCTTIVEPDMRLVTVRSDVEE